MLDMGKEDYRNKIFDLSRMSGSEMGQGDGYGRQAIHGKYF